MLRNVCVHFDAMVFAGKAWAQAYQSYGEWNAERNEG